VTSFFTTTKLVINLNNMTIVVAIRISINQLVIVFFLLRNYLDLKYNNYI